MVYAKKPFAGPQAVLAYLSRYTHRVAISNRRLISADETGVTFRWKDYRIEGPGRHKTMTLPTHEFIRRFLIHVPCPSACIASAITDCSPTAKTAPPISLVLANCSPCRKIQRSLIRRPRRQIRPAPRSAETMPVLRRPHDHHRDLRAWLPAQARSGSDQDRHLIDAVTVDQRLCSHQSLSQALDRQRLRSRQAANLACRPTANVAAQRPAGPSIPVLTSRAIAPTASIQNE